MTTECTKHHHHHDHHEPAGSPTADLRHEHDLILRALAVMQRLVNAPALDRQALGEVVEFLRTFADRCHHGKEEEHLFPVLAARGVPVDGGPIGVMLAEHEQGRAMLRLMADGGDAEAVDAARRYAAVLREHIAKENDVLFPIAEQALTPAEQERVRAGFEAIEQTVVGPGIHERLLADLVRMENVAGPEPLLDVRDVAPRERHGLILGTFERLAPSQAFVLVNDHDPKPLYYQFSAEMPGRFGWEYLEAGPEVWRVRVSKTG
jgi:hemerythrin-like domain-containing protein/uncharacterized protein (DUF2249 family)